MTMKKKIKCDMNNPVKTKHNIIIIATHHVFMSHKLSEKCRIKQKGERKEREDEFSIL